MSDTTQGDDVDTARMIVTLRVRSMLSNMPVSDQASILVDLLARLLVKYPEDKQERLITALTGGVRKLLPLYTELDKEGVEI
jgi:hypothetical protein